jgi:MazG family protein
VGKYSGEGKEQGPWKAPGPADVLADDEAPAREGGLAEMLAGAEIPPGLGEKFETLARVMAKLRSADGCPWDLQQTPEKLAHHLLEEAYETVDAIDSRDWGHVGEELGDLMLQIVFQSQIASESGRFDLALVVEGITDKLERRHPHIFGAVEADTAEQVSVNWERIKREQEGKEAALAMPPGLPAMMAAIKIQNHAAREGFDWPDADGVFSKLDEEIAELHGVRDKGERELVEHELGDLLFTVVNLARHLGVDPEQALRKSSREFVRRYAWMESEAAQQEKSLASLDLDEMERLWQAAKEKA